MSRPRGAPEGAPLRRSALKSVHWTDLPGYAGRASPNYVEVSKEEPDLIRSRFRSIGAVH